MSKIHLLKKITILLTLFLFIAVAGCSSKDEIIAEEEETQDPGDDDPTDDGMSGDPVTGDPDLIISEVQDYFLFLKGNFAATTAGITRQRAMFGVYINDVFSGNTNTGWRKAYQIVDGRVLLEKLNELETYDVPNHLGLAEVLQAYSMMILVDIYGDVPYTQALDPDMFPNPGLDSGSDVYNAQLNLLDAAITHLQQNPSSLPEDKYFLGGFDKSKWIALANTLKLRAYLNLRLTDPARATQGINGLLNKNLIDTPQEDFQFQYGNAPFPFDRHPFFNTYYGSGGAGLSYIANGFYDYLNAGDVNPPFVENGIVDPRLRYYIYRQSDQAPAGSNLPCDGDSNYDYCYVGNLYWGRDHADDAGVPSDGVRKTVPGLYPIGGAFDRDLFVQARAVTEGLEGAGIAPIFLSSFTNFMLAESALTLNTNGNAVSYLEQGIRLSMQKVSDFSEGQELGGFGISPGSTNEYVLRVLDEYSSANTNGKLAIIEREFYLASWGNTIEAYNLYRRTGFPNLQAPVFDAGPFPRVFQYASTPVSINPNIQQQQVTNQTFWDNNPAGFID